MKKTKIKFNMTSPEPYSFENERRDLEYPFQKSIYDTAKWLGDTTDFELEHLNPGVKLTHLKDEIKTRIRITQQEIFYIGKLLCYAKEICQENGMSFKKWIEKSFDFKYETANNFMNVFKNCFGFREVAFQVPISILYKLSSPSFPQELREYIFLKVDFKKSSSEIFTKMADKYRKGGIEAVEQDVMEINRGVQVNRQVNYTFDMVESALRTLKGLKDKIIVKGGTKMRLTEDYNELVKDHQPEAAEVNTKLFNALSISIQSLEVALSESRFEINQYWKSIEEKM